MKYLAIFLIIFSISAPSLNVHSTVVHVQTSKGKHIKASKAKLVKKTVKCPVKFGKTVKNVKAPANGKDIETCKH